MANMVDNDKTKPQEGTTDSHQKALLWRIVTYMPARCRWDPENPPKFTIWLNLLFAFSACFTVANLYYTHPILVILAEEFNVSNERAALIPTVAQAGYAAGLVLICPAGDFLRRRHLILSVMWLCATLWIGLCITRSEQAFLVLTFFTAFTTVTPQLLMPLVGTLAPPHRRASALSYCFSGLLMGVLMARLLSGIITQYTSWRNVYWMAFAVQYSMLIMLWLFMPDYPSVNPSGLSYFGTLWSMVTITIKSPVLVQACIVGFLTQASFTSFWTTLTFLLSSPPYNFSTVIIGLFALIGIGALCFGPLYSRLVIDKLAPVVSALLGELLCLAGSCIGAYTGTFTVAGPIIQAFTIDLGLQAGQISMQSSIYGAHPEARARVNTVYMLSAFSGQLMGTAVGNSVYAQSGWVRSASMNVGFIGGTIIILLIRGPWEKGWVGWRGGWSVWRQEYLAKRKQDRDQNVGDEEKDTNVEEQREQDRVLDTSETTTRVDEEPKEVTIAEGLDLSDRETAKEEETDKPKI